MIISVVDRGPGVPEEDRLRIFERFSQAADERRTPSGGSGLGLYVAKSLSEALGITLRVEDREGGGSVFSANVPCEAPGAAASPSCGQSDHDESEDMA